MKKMHKPVITISHFNKNLQLQNKQGWLVVLLIVLATCLISYPVYSKRVPIPIDSDFPVHIGYAQDMIDGHALELPPAVLSHPAYQIILIGIYYLALQKLDLYTLAVLLQVLVQIITVLILYFWMGNAVKGEHRWLRAGLAVALTLVAPVMLLVPWDRLYYLGYIGLANYHNPTIHLLKPVALVCFILALRGFSPGRRFVEDHPGGSILDDFIGADQTKFFTRFPTRPGFNGDPVCLKKTMPLIGTW